LKYARSFSPLILGLLLISGTLLSQTNFWQQTKGPYNGFVLSLARDSSGHLYSGIVGGFNHEGGIYRSDDGGATWQYSGLQDDDVQALAVNANDVIYVGSFYGGVSRSTDHGASWASADSGMTGANVSSLAVGSNGHLFAGTDAGGSGQLFRSTDDGANWTPLGLTNHDVTSIAIDVNGHLFALTAQEGILKSTNDGDSWAPASNGLTYQALSLFGAPGGALYAGTYFGVYRSTDNGATWVRTDSGLTSPYGTRAFALTPNGDLYAGTDGEGVFRSTDQGSHWTKVSRRDNQVVALLGNSNGDLIVGMNGDGLFRYTDQAQELVQVGLKSADVLVLARTPAGNIFAGTFNGLFQSSDQGNSWVQNSHQDSWIQGIAVDSSGHFLVNNNRSTDNGQTWQYFAPEGKYITVSPNGHIFAAGTGIYRTTDDGVEWTEITNGTNSNVTDLLAGETGSVFAASYDGVYRTTNEGDTWVNMLPILSGVKAVCLATGSSGELFAGSGYGEIFRSTDDGTNWTRVDSGAITADISVLKVNSHGVIFAGTYGGGVFRSTDAGASWTQLSAGLTSDLVQALIVDADGYIYAGADGGGVSRSFQPTVTSVDEGAPGRPTTFTLAQNYPNPFNPSTEINFSVARRSFVQLKVYNVTGEEVATLVYQELSPGNYRTTWIAGNVASGVYFYRLIADSFSETRKLVLIR
jgi:photosystem II stability/assembly factor-like uncharacterized protein